LNGRILRPTTVCRIDKLSESANGLDFSSHPLFDNLAGRSSFVTKNVLSPMADPRPPTERPLLIMLYNQVFCRLEAFIRPIVHSGQVAAYPLSIRELEAALRARLADCHGPDFDTDPGPPCDGAAPAAAPDRTIPNEKLEYLHRRIAALKSVLVNFESENQQLNSQIESLTRGGSAISDRPERIGTEWEQITNYELALDEIDKEHALAISRERGQLSSITEATNRLTGELALIDRRLEAIARGRAPAEPLNGAVIGTKVNFVQPPAQPSARPFRRKRVLFRKPRPKPPPPPPPADVQPRYIPIRCSHLWETDEELQCTAAAEPEDTRPSVLLDERDVSVDRFGVIQCPPVSDVTLPDVEGGEGSLVMRPPSGDSREAVRGDSPDGDSTEEEGSPRSETTAMAVVTPELAAGAIAEPDLSSGEEEEAAEEYAPIVTAQGTDGCSDQEGPVVPPFVQEPPSAAVDCGGQTLVAQAEGDVGSGVEEHERGAFNPPECSDADAARGSSGGDAPESSADEPLIEAPAGMVAEPQGTPPPRPRRSFAIQTCIVTSVRPDEGG
jgi:hypothetical protein